MGGFTTSQDEYVAGKDVTLKASSAVTATGTTTGMDVGGLPTLRAQVRVTNVTGGTSPTVTVTVQTSHDNGVADAWRTAGAAFAALDAVGNSPYQCFVVDRYVRVSYAITGTPTGITFSVEGEAV